jgi:NAD(P)-dependent dehydrogenase (short-subunit alcohol dehydrogenase family)
MEGKVIAISGGSSGMGLALAKLLGTRGARLSICDVVQQNLDKAAKEIETKDLLTFKCDVRDVSQVHDWISQTVEKFGRLDGAANMAGIIGQRPGSNFIDSQDEDDWDRIIGINLTVGRRCNNQSGPNH